jgi:hypothetical protein
MSERKTDPWIFRDDHKTIGSDILCQELEAHLRQLAHHRADQTVAVAALLQAGQLEAALADSKCCSAPEAALLTDTLADHFCGTDRLSVQDAVKILRSLILPGNLTVSTPEGFAYYNLQPGDFARLRAEVATKRPMAVIGIRSIGTTLSAVVAAALRKTGNHAERITVRPTGHPYDRTFHFASVDVDWIAKWQARSAHFLIVDEGPGRSGSTFLAVAEALIEAGIPVERIELLGSREPDVRGLCAPDGERRWRRFHFRAVQGHIQDRFVGCRYVGSGNWREIFLPCEALWPACWPEMERSKFLSADGRCLFKFEGLGSIGDQALTRAIAIAEAGFGPAVENAGDGFAAYSVTDNKSLKTVDLSTSMLDRMAAYLAFRKAEFRAATSRDDILEEAVRFNFELEFGEQWTGELEPLHTTSAVVADGRMQPHEWVHAEENSLKCDAASHGDDHFLPGPCDIAWDLAGAVVEWNMPADAKDYLLTRFSRIAGDDVRRRFPAFEFAYSLLRLAYCRMALTTVEGKSEEARLQEACLQYRKHVHGIMSSSRKPCSGPSVLTDSLPATVQEPCRVGQPQF